MTRRERLMATLHGRPVDRPAVSFYEITGFDQRPDNPDPLNIFNDPSWRPLIELATAKTDRTVRRGLRMDDEPPDPVAALTSAETWSEGLSRFRRTTIRAGRRTLTSVTRRDPDIDTEWTVEHFLKDADDLRAWLDLPEPEPGGRPHVAHVLEAEAALGDTGIVMLDMGDPLCDVAWLFDMGEYTVLAMTERDLFRRALERQARRIMPKVEAFARALPGHVWRICGPEYASPPYLPPELFREYAVKFDTPIVEAIQRYGGFARIHSHGNLRAILDDIAATGCTALDPIEPPPQGDVSLRYVRERYGRQMVLFGNLETSDIETLPAEAFERKIVTAIEEGTAGEGRGFVLMPAACPAGRQLSERSLRNYERMIQVIERL